MGGWAGSVALWGGISVLCGGSLPWGCAVGGCLDDMTTVHKKVVSGGCCEVAAWGCSGMLGYGGWAGVGLVPNGGWPHRVLGAQNCGGKWRSTATKLVE